MQAILYNKNTNDVIMVLKVPVLTVTDDKIVDDQGNGLKGYNPTIVGYKLVTDVTDLTDPNSDTGYIETVVGLSTPDHDDLDIEVKVKREAASVDTSNARSQAITNLLNSGDIPYDPDA